jgi:hypothetical protein
MATEPREPDDWELLQTYSSASAAEVDAAYLRSEGVAAKVRPVGDIPGTVDGAQVMVDSTLVHRARWLLKFDAVSEAELEYLATGSLAPPDQEVASETKRRNRSAWVIGAALVLAALLAIAHIAGNVAI